MKVKNLEYHRRELHKVSEKIKKLKKDLSITKRKKGEEILYKLLDKYRYSLTKKDLKKDKNLRGYVRNKINLFYKLSVSKVFHQSVIVMLGTKKRRKK